MKYSVTSGECCSPKSPQVVIFPPSFPIQEQFNSLTDQKQLYTGRDPERGTVTSSEPYMQIASGNANFQSASTTDLISQGSPVAIEACLRPSTLELQRHHGRHKMARYDSRKRNKDSVSSAEYSDTSSDRGFVSRCSFYIVAAFALLAVIFAGVSIIVMLQLMAKCNDLERKLSTAQTSYTLAQQDTHTCLPCGELSQGPFEEENEDLKQLIWKQEYGVRTCCAKSAAQLSVMLNLFAKRKRLEACAQESILNENLTSSACNNASTPVSTPAKPNGTISAHLVVGDPHEGSMAGAHFEPIRHWRQGLPGTHLTNINLTAENSRIVVPETGLYFLYSQVSFLVYYDVEQTLKDSSQSLFHVVYRYNAIYPLDGSEALLRSVITQCWEKQKDYGRYTSYTGASVKLNKGDQLYVKVSRIQNVNKSGPATYFGIYKIN